MKSRLPVQRAPRGRITPQPYFRPAPRIGGLGGEVKKLPAPSDSHGIRACVLSQPCKGREAGDAAEEPSSPLPWHKNSSMRVLPYSTAAAALAHRLAALPPIYRVFLTSPRI